jgi:hypothetical protein
VKVTELAANSAPPSTFLITLIHQQQHPFSPSTSRRSFEASSATS